MNDSTLTFCKCGCPWIDHAEGSIFSRTLGVNSGRCVKCPCKRFRKMGVMTYAEAKARVKNKEEKPSSPNQQPTSGTSQSQSPSQYQSGGIVGLSLTVSNRANPYPSSPSQKLFPSETRLTPVVGFRSWHSRPFHRVGIGPSYWLGSYNDTYGVWKPGRNTALCLARSPLSFEPVPAHGAGPQPECTCGFYVLNDFDEVPFNPKPIARSTQIDWVPAPPMMVGAVVGWGRVIQHGDQGWRAEFAQVIALLDCKVSDEHLQITHQVAEVYGVPVVERKALELLAKEYGDPLPKLAHNNKAVRSGG